MDDRPSRPRAARATSRHGVDDALRAALEHVDATWRDIRTGWITPRPTADGSEVTYDAHLVLDAPDAGVGSA